MLLLCLTGLPLIFSSEIRSAGEPELAPESAKLPASLDAIVASAGTQHPGTMPLYLFADKQGRSWLVKLAARTDDERDAVFSRVDAESGKVLGAPQFKGGVMGVILRLHVDLFAGLPGRIFLGLMGLLLLVAIVSGVVLYRPFMSRLEFGEVRHQRSPRTRWLDLHNLFGIVTAAWFFVVGSTGAINTVSGLALRAWQAEQLSVLKTRGAHAIATRSKALSVQDVRDRIARYAAGADIRTIAFPGTLLATPDHFAVQLRGGSGIARHLSDTVLVDRFSGEVLAQPDRPWYVTPLQLSRPLHFGDFAGLPLKLLWAALDLVTIAVLWSGLVLWWKKRRGAKHKAIR
jgi:uncharacterized iron-regulated membrane protein